MDWRGCNFFHGRLPLSPVFPNTKEALAWLKFQVGEGVYTDGMILGGHHAGEYTCSMGCNDREIYGFDSIFFHSLKKKKSKKKGKKK